MTEEEAGLFSKYSNYVEHLLILVSPVSVCV